MDTKDLRGLAEAYSEMYAPQEVDEATAMAKRGYDEAPIRQKIAKSTGGGAAADRASSLENKSTFGDAKKAKQRQDLARKQRGDFRKTTSSNPGLHVGQHKSDDPKVKEKQAARGAQRGALTPAEKKQFNREEFVVDEGKLPLDKERRDRIGRQIGRRTYSISPKKYDQMDKMSGALKSAQKQQNNEEFDLFDTILEFLCVEGFAETLEEAEWMMANELDAEDIQAILEGSYEDRIAANNKKYDANRKRAAQRAAARNDARAQGKTGAVPGVGYVTPRKEKETYTDSSGKTRHAKGL